MYSSEQSRRIRVKSGQLKRTFQCFQNSTSMDHMVWIGYLLFRSQLYILECEPNSCYFLFLLLFSYCTDLPPQTNNECTASLLEIIHNVFSQIFI